MPAVPGNSYRYIVTANGIVIETSDLTIAGEKLQTSNGLLVPYGELSASSLVLTKNGIFEVLTTESTPT